MFESIDDVPASKLFFVVVVLCCVVLCCVVGVDERQALRKIHSIHW